MADYEQRLRIKLIPDTSEIDKAVDASAKNAGRKVRDAAKGAAGGSGPARRSDYSPSADPLLDAGTPAQRRAQREAGRRNAASRPQSGPAGAPPGPGAGGGIFQKMHTFFGTQPMSAGMQRRQGFGMMKQGLGQLAGGMFTGGGASGIMGGAAGMLGGMAGMAGGPYGMIAAKAVEVVQKVIQTMDAAVNHYKQYNASIAIANGKFEAASHRFSISMGKALAPTLTAWSDLKVKVLDAAKSFAPAIKMLATFVGNALKGIGMFVQVLGKGAELYFTASKNIAASAMWIMGKIPKSGVADLSFKDHKKNVEKALDGDDGSTKGDFFSGFMGARGRPGGRLAAGPLATQIPKTGIGAILRLPHGNLMGEAGGRASPAAPSPFSGTPYGSGQFLPLPPTLPNGANIGRPLDWTKKKTADDAASAKPAVPFFGDGIQAAIHHNYQMSNEFRLQDEAFTFQLLAEVRETVANAMHSTRHEQWLTTSRMAAAASSL
jgi:hypothetical protein